ncbi:MAG TPA: hypothetical protein VFX53_05340 [Pedococcus sp.]|nr:hypothetical protein [Pedococcus sp.]
MSETFTVPARFCGPPESGNGGWTSGHLAALVAVSDGSPAVSVRLRTPPPLDRTMAVHHGGTGTVEVTDGDVLVASAQPAGTLDRTGLPAPASFAEAEAVAGSYAGLHNHPFPTCFSCGVDRDPGDARCLRPGPLPGRAGVHAAAWVPTESTPEIVWAALDCPGAWALGVGGRPMVLGTMTAEVQRLPAVGEEHVVMAWGRGSEGRKNYCGTALYAADGALLALAEATWIAIDPTTIRPVGSSS